MYYICIYVCINMHIWILYYACTGVYLYMAYIKIITQNKTSKSRHLPALDRSYHCISRTFLYLLPVILMHRFFPPLAYSNKGGNDCAEWWLASVDRFIHHSHEHASWAFHQSCKEFLRWRNSPKGTSLVVFSFKSLAHPHYSPRINPSLSGLFPWLPLEFKPTQ